MSGNLSPNEILIEFAKGLENPAYIIESYFKTFDKTQEGFVPFKLFPKQQEIIDALCYHNYNVITKPRQAGVSTTTAAHVAVKTAWADSENPEKVLILANKQDMAQEFLAKVKDFLLQIPRWVWGPEYYGTPQKEELTIFLTDSKKQLTLPNGSIIRAVATSKDALRGYTPTWLIMDEAAYIDDGEEVFGAAMTSLGTGGKCTLISTPNGHDKLYYAVYTAARKKENDFNVVELKWYQDLRYNKKLKWLKEDLEEFEVDFTMDSYNKRLENGWKPTSPWYQDMCRAMNNDRRMIARELDVSFTDSGGGVIEAEFIEYQRKNNMRDPKWYAGFKKEIWIWEEPIPGHKYVLGSDVSRGDGEDYSSFIIIDTTLMEQVVEYKGKIQPDLLAQLIEEYGNLYEAYTVIDIAGGMGVPTVLKLLEYDYKRLHYDDPRDKLLRERRDLSNHSKGDKIPGFNCQSVRIPMIAHMEFSIRTNAIKVRSIRCISEMETFVYRNGRADHTRSTHDDCLMALAMGLWVLENNFKKLEQSESKSKAVLASWISGNDKYTAEVNMSNRAKAMLPITSSTNNNNNSGNFMWLFSKKT
jgi:hypothetical protein